jgi:hypothetical protein
MGCLPHCEATIYSFKKSVILRHATGSRRTPGGGVGEFIVRVRQREELPLFVRPAKPHQELEAPYIFK